MSPPTPPPPICLCSHWYECVAGVCYFFFRSLASLVFALDSLLLSRRSLTSALFCISYDFWFQLFWSFGKDVAGKKRENWFKKKKVCGLCTDVKVKLIKTRQRTVVVVLACLGVGWGETLEGPEENVPAWLPAVWEEGGFKNCILMKHLN